MALQQRSDDYDEAKERLLTYCQENDITSPFYDYPFEWPELEERPRSPTPELVGILPDVDSFDESLDWTSGLEGCLNEKLVAEPEDLLDIRNYKPLEYEMLPPHPRIGPSVLRKFGPNSLEKIAPLLHADVLLGEEGMDIPTDTRELLKAFENDSKILATKEQADFLKDVIFRYDHEDSVDLIHSNVPSHF
jgi:hypothetical protein